jgi:hypothetical protein
MKKVLQELLVVAFSLIFLHRAYALEFSADQITKSDGDTITSKIYMKDKKFRVETSSQPGYSITRQDKNTMWIVMPEQRSYMEMTFNPTLKPKVDEKFTDEISRKLIGSENVNGHPSDKYEITYKEKNEVQRVYQWMAKDINFPIKTAAIDGSWSSEFKNIKIEKQPDDLFEVPSGFQKMSMPSMPGMMP